MSNISKIKVSSFQCGIMSYPENSFVAFCSLSSLVSFFLRFYKGILITCFFALASNQDLYSQYCATATTNLAITPTLTSQCSPIYSTGIRAFNFVATAGCTYEFTTCGQSAMDTYLRLYSTGTGGTVLSQNDDFCGTQSQITWTAPANGTYSVLLTRFTTQGGGNNCAALNANAAMCYRIVSCGNSTVDCLNNDSCLEPTSIALNAEGGPAVCITDCNTGSNPGPDFTGNNCYDMTNGTVWFSITTGLDAASINVAVTSTVMTNPEFTVFTNACGPYTIVECFEGLAGNATVNNILVSANTTYLIAVSNWSGSSGEFQLCIAQNADNSACNTNNNLVVTATSLGSPLGGPYQPGEQVTFCYTITDYQQVNCNYLGAVIPSFGDCWAPSSFNAQGAPVIINTPLNVVGVIQPCPPGPPCAYAACVGTPAGTWSWFPAGTALYNVNGSLTAGSPMPAGWYFLSSYSPSTGSCAGDPTDPDLTYGDGNFPQCEPAGSIGTANEFDYTLCFTLTAKGSSTCAGTTDCAVTIKTYADGEFGVWNNVGCTVDAPSSVPGVLNCCTQPVASFSGITSVCSGQSTAITLGSTIPLATSYSWTVTQSNVTGAIAGSGSTINQTLSLVNPAISGTVVYNVIPTSNGCVGLPLVITITVNPRPAIANLPTQTCSGVAFSVTPSAASPNIIPAGTTYSWSAPVVTGGITGGSAGSGASITGTLTNPGATPATATYTVTATSGTAPNQCTNTFTLTVTVNPRPAIANSTIEACSGVAFSFTPSSLSPNVIPLGTTYSWSAPVVTGGITGGVAGSGTSISGTLVNPGTTAAVATYTVTATSGISPNQCTSTFTLAVTVNPRPIVANVATQACSGNAFNVIPTSSSPNVIPAGTTYSWSAPTVTGGITGGVAGSGSSINGTLVNPGTTPATATYSVTATSGTAPNQCTNTFTVTVTVNPTLTPTFNPVGPFCSGSTISALPTNSLNGVTGTWSPGINNTTTTTYTFTPNSGQCATPTQLTITINPSVTPTFAAVGPYCSGASIPSLPTTSINGITGTWGPTINNTTTTTYTFTPAAGQCATTTTLTITVNSNVTPTFAAVGPYCSGATIPALASTSINGITGTWGPAINNTATTTYTFTPSAGQCASTTTLTITINPNVAPTFNAVGPYCSGAAIPALPTTSINSITGTWSPALNNIATTTYTFTPNTGQCATTSQLTITITDILDFVNLQFPASATICQTVNFTAFGQIYNTGAINTPDAGQALGVTAQIGYSTTNTNPSTWTNWSNASFNTQIGNNDEYSGVLSGLAPGTYYYTFRFQINNCGWQYGGYSGTGGGAWGGSNVSGVLTVVASPNAGNDNTLTVCATGNPVDLYTALGTAASITGSWSGPSVLSGGYLGTFNPTTNAAGLYTYTVTAGGVCPNDIALVTVSITSSPTASIAYASPVCISSTVAAVPSISGATNGTFSATPTGLGINTMTGSFNPASATPGTYTITYSIAAANGCSAFQTSSTVVVSAAPLAPTLSPTNPCASSNLTFTAANGTWYEFFVNGVSTGPPSATNTLNAGALAAGSNVCVRSYPAPPLMDGDLTDAAWTPIIPGTTGGPASQLPFTVADTRLDGLKMLNRNGLIYFGLAGNEIDGAAQVENNRILLFIDSKPGGFNNLAAWTNRSNAGPFTNGVRNLNGGIVFDAGFEADYILCINRANVTGTTTNFDLYDMVTNTNTFIGNSPSPQFGYQESFTDNDLTKGFEFYIPLSSIGTPASLKLFGMIVNDPGSNAASLISNQFFSVANTGENNYGDGAVFFNSAAPNPVTYVVSQDCYQEACTYVIGSSPVSFNTIPPICYGAAAPTLPATSVEGVTGSWSPLPVSNTASGTYTFTPNAACTSPVQVSVQVYPQVIIDGIYHD